MLQINVDLGVDSTVGLVGSAFSAFLTTLVVGAILVAVVPEYTEERMAAVVDDPVGSLVYGLAVFLVVIVVMVVFAITIVGLLVALPLALLLYVVWALGSTIAYLAIADRLVGHDDGWTLPLLVAAGINGALVLSVVGGLVGFLVGAAGFGAVMAEYL